jgi:DNA-directed RNA polymerase specialized sigma24 family protein
MDDTALQKFFRQPTHIYHRQYEALRAIVIDGRSQKEVADEFGYQAHALRQLMYQFRRSLEADRTSTESPFFKPSRDAVLP